MTDLHAPPEDDLDLSLTPPSNPDYERWVIGTCLDRPTLIDELRTKGLIASTFYEAHHETIWHAIVTLHVQGKPTDAITVGDELHRRKALSPTLRAATDGNIRAYLATLQGDAHLPDNAHYYTDTLLDLAARRRHDNLATRLRATIRDGTSDDALALLREHLEDEQRISEGAKPTGFLDFADLLTRPRAPIHWICSPILADARITLLYSPGKAGKSLIAMEAALAIATGGTALLDQHPRRPEHVLYVDQEMTEEDWAARTADMGYTPDDGPKINEHLHVANLHAWAPLDTPAGGQQLLGTARATGARVVILDTISKLIAGEENSNDTQQALYRHSLVPLKRDGIAVLILDHTGKDLERGARGGSAKTDNVDLAIKISKRGQDHLTLTPTHVRFHDDAVDGPVYIHRLHTTHLHHAVETHPGTTGGADVFRPTGLMERISRFVETSPGCDKSTVLDVVNGRAEYKRSALALLIAEGYIRDERGQHNKAVLTEIRPYREQLETQEGDEE